MDYLTNCINKLDTKFKESKNSRDSLHLSIIASLIYFITRKKVYLDKAQFVIEKQNKINPIDFGIHILNCLINLELNNMMHLQTVLEDMNGYKSFIRSSNEDIYMWYMAISIRYDIKTQNKGRFNNERQLNKNIKYLSEKENRLALFLYGLILVEKGEIEEGIKFISKSHKSGYRGVYLYFSLVYILQKKISIKDMDEMIRGYISWSINKCIDITQFMNIYEKRLIKILKGHYFLLNKMYACYKFDWILKELLNINIEQGNITDSAYNIYNEAVKRQLHVKDLSKYLLESAYKNDIKIINKYMIKKYLYEDKLDIQIKGYLYDIILGSKSMISLREHYKEHSLNFAKECVRNKIAGKNYNRLYKFLIDEGYINNLDKEEIEFIEGVLINKLFNIKIILDEKNIKGIWVLEKERKEPKYYQILDCTCNVESFTQDFKIVALDKNNRIRYLKPKIIRALDNLSIKLYMYFYNRGYIKEELLISLTNYFFSIKKPKEQFLNIIKETLKINNLSRNFKNRVLALLSSYLYKLDKIEESLQYCSLVNIEFLKSQELEEILQIHLKNRNTDYIIKTLKEKGKDLSNSVLYSILKDLITNDLIAEEFVDFQYKLILNLWYDEAFLKNVVKYYRGTNSSLKELRKSLEIISITNLDLDIKILNNVMCLRSLDDISEKIFVSVYNSISDKIVMNFSYYCIYEVLTNDYKLELDTLNILEDIYLKNQDEIITLGLTHYYISNNVVTKLSEKIIHKAIAVMENMNLILPVMKKVKDKKILNSYMKKNQPFFYKSYPNLNVSLCYKSKNDKDYKIVKMNYFKFGIFYCNIIQFFDEELIYYFVEEREGGTIQTKESKVKNNEMIIINKDKEQYFEINNALIYDKMFKYEEVENIIENFLQDEHITKGKLI